MKTERRSFEIRAAKDAPLIEGYAIVWGSMSRDLGGFREIVQRGAVSHEDVLALFNHNRDAVLGRLSSGTLKLEEDETGLRMEVTPPSATWANDLLESIRRGDISQQSFAFRVLPDGQTWEERDGGLVRTLTAIKIYDVSVVTEPAYEATSATVRSASEALADYTPPTLIPDFAAMRRRLFMAGAYRL